MNKISHIGLCIEANVMDQDDELSDVQSGLSLFPVDALLKQMGYEELTTIDDCLGIAQMMAERLAEMSPWEEALSATASVKREGALVLAVVTPEFMSLDAWETLSNDFIELSHFYGQESPVLMDGGDLSLLLESVLPAEKLVKLQRVSAKSHKSSKL